MHNFGLPQRTIDEIHAIFAKHSKVKKVIVYGSRAMGNYSIGSDIDMTMIGDSLEYRDLSRIAGELDDSSIPYMVDLSIFEKLDHANLKDHINRRGKVFYDRYTGWETVGFEKCLDKVKTPLKIQKKDYLEQGKFPIVSQEASLINGYYNDASILFRLKSPVIVFGDHTQVLKYIDFDFVMGADGIKILQPIGKLNPKYFYYFLMLKMPKSIGYARHYRFLKELEVACPPLAEQKRIVAKLDTAFAAIDKAITAIKTKQTETAKLKQALLTNELTAPPATIWETAKLEEVCEIMNGGTPKSNVLEYWKGDVNWLTPKDMGQMAGRQISDTPRKITKLGLNSSSAKLIPPYSVIISTRAPIGHLAINTVEMAFNQGCRGLVPSKRIDSVFLFHFLSANIKKLNDLGTGTTFKELPSRALKNFELPLPPLAEQQRIITKLDTIFAKIDTANKATKQQLADYTALKSAVLNQELHHEAT